ncbi:unnamed protein product, partial [Prorocentrum cordatum]
ESGLTEDRSLLRQAAAAKKGRKARASSSWWLDKVGNAASAAKHRRVLQEKQRKLAEAACVAPLSQRVTMAHEQVQELNQKLEKAVRHFERLVEVLGQQRQWVQQFSDDLEEREKVHRGLDMEFNAQVVDVGQQPPQQMAALSVA